MSLVILSLRDITPPDSSERRLINGADEATVGETRQGVKVTESKLCLNREVLWGEWVTGFA
jgi:hypothetical protein